MANRGRPCGFDRNAALMRAMYLFWERGYEATSISDLAAAMGIKPPSLYAAYGSKESLFRQAVELYASSEAAGDKDVLWAHPTARAAIEALLRGAVDRIAHEDGPKGCFMVLGAVNCTPENAHIGEYLARQRQAGQQAIFERISLGVEAGDVDPGTDVAALAGFYATVLRGLSLSARDGAGKIELDGIVTCAMASWNVLASDCG
ncbi:TetR family transcriptional regulator [Brucella endophytica]|uniref:TetR family transcriptional regulator n=1 Tax=Brucella endophytica TaxID=1963359 RepID=A0A916WN15_9HYPH|nr:TetR/AcrR family transcriptional regulator [Brucella endophytica]GGB13157.1 TetR family transcriptional regulator [Brucella endophytica]